MDHVEFKNSLQEITSVQSLSSECKGVVLVDFSWVLHRSYHAYSSLTIQIDNKGGSRESYGYHSVRGIGAGDNLTIFTGDFYGTIRAVLALIRKYPDYTIILCVDSPNPEKKGFMPAYKGGRGDTSSVYEKIFEIISSLCLLPCVSLAYHEKKEADDFMFNLSQVFSCSMGVVIYASDKDLYQSLTKDNIKISNKIGIELGSEAVEYTFGVPAERVSFLRSICSLDKSDNLRAYPRFPRVLAVEIVKKFETPQEFLDSNFTASTKAREAWVQKIRLNPEIMLNLYQIHKIGAMRDIKLYTFPSSFKFINKYRCVSLDKQIRTLRDSNTTL